MSKIRIKNFGPVKEGYLEDGGWMDIKKVTLFIGNQGSGKSTVAKVITTMIWLEKAINRGDISEKDISGDIYHAYFEYMLTHNYFTKDTEIAYEGDIMSCTYTNEKPFPIIHIKRDLHYKVPKIMYVPAERNFLSVIQNAFLLKDLPESIITFAQELRKSHLALNGHLIDLPLQDIKFKYDKKNEKSILAGNGYEIELKESSSGYHSMVPLFLVSKFLSDEIEKGESVLRDQLSAEQSIRRNKEVADVSFDNSLNPQEKEKLFKEIDAKYLNTCFINIVEEPEQNLFPDSQQKLLTSLLEFANKRKANKLIITSHSPYLINYLTLAVKAYLVLNNMSNEEVKLKVNKIVSLNSLINPDDLIIYELNEATGIIKALPNYKGLPSDENYLNSGLEESNELFAQLQEIEKGWR
jgi:predicted ATPase